MFDIVLNAPMFFTDLWEVEAHQRIELSHIIYVTGYQGRNKERENTEK